jgi:hypothetical protein
MKPIVMGLARGMTLAKTTLANAGGNAMKTAKRSRSKEELALPKHGSHVVLGVEGALAGAAVGCFAGPVGVGALAEEVIDEEQRRFEAHDAELDEEIGVTSADLGAAPPDQPSAQFGAYSGASSGAAERTGTTSDGPMQDIED